jgi:type IV secretory pathway VirB10-like protein
MCPVLHPDIVTSASFRLVLSLLKVDKALVSIGRILEDRANLTGGFSTYSSEEVSSMHRVMTQLSIMVVALVFGMTTFAQEPAPAPPTPAPTAPPAVPAPAPAPTPAPTPVPSTGETKGEGEKQMGGDRHRDKAERKAEKERRKAERKAEKEQRKAEKKTRKQGRGHDKDDDRDHQDKEGGKN